MSKFVPRYFTKSSEKPFADGVLFIQFLEENHARGVTSTGKIVWDEKPYGLEPKWFEERNTIYPEKSLMEIARAMARENGVM